MSENVNKNQKYGPDMNQLKINCLKCVHYHVTWDPGFPNGCRAMKFKSKEIPSAMVLKNTGHECLLFALKSRNQKTSGNNGNFSEQV